MTTIDCIVKSAYCRLQGSLFISAIKDPVTFAFDNHEYYWHEQRSNNTILFIPIMSICGHLRL